jgi:hypothetical protein
MRIAVIGAPNLGYTNPGMLTVDLAAAGVLKRAAPDAEVSWFTLHPPDELTAIHRSVDPRDLPFTWRSLVDHFDEVCGNDAILLWGDFLQARHYFVEDAADRLVAGSQRQISSSQALDALYRCMLFSDAPLPVLRKIVIFGSTILFNRQSDYMADRYGEHFFRLVRNCAAVWTREPLSALKMQHIRQDHRVPALGIDPALLLRDEDLVSLSTTGWSEAPPFDDRVALFFGARTRPPLSLLSFVGEVTARLGLHLEWLPWFPIHELLRPLPRSLRYRPAMAALVLHNRRRIERLMTRGTAYTVGDLLGAVPRYRLIITDTYHLCVNAWRVGTPAICFGNLERPPWQQSLDDYKKRVFYDMYDAADFYFNTSAIDGRARRKRAVAKVLEIAADHSMAQAITARIRAHARSVEQLLGERLSELAPVSGLRM